MSEQNGRRAVILCTKHRGVFFGYVEGTPQQTMGKDPIFLYGARMAIYWGTSRGVMQLAFSGPTSSSKLSPPVDMEVRNITAVFEVSAEARQAWEAAS